MAGASLSSLDFFQQLHAHYDQVLTKWADQPALLDAILHVAWGSFETNV